MRIHWLFTQAAQEKQAYFLCPVPLLQGSPDPGVLNADEESQNKYQNANDSLKNKKGVVFLTFWVINQWLMLSFKERRGRM